MIKQTGQIQFEHMVCGGGLVGAIWALYLRRRSNSVAIFQSYDDLRQELIPSGRSINLVLARKALDALQQLQIKEEIIKNTIPIKGQMIHCSNGQNTKILYGLTQNDINYCVARNKLNQNLLNILDTNNIPIFFQHTLAQGNIQTNEYIYKVPGEYEDTERQVKVKCKYMYGADGAGSKVRQLILNKKNTSANVQWFDADYKQLFLPTKQDSSYAFDPNWVHLWPRGGHMMMGHANPNGSFSLTVILPSKGPNSFSQINTQDKIYEYFQQNYPDLANIIPNLPVQFAQNPVGYLGTIYVPQWHYKDKVVVLGDAAHTITPFLWQAVNVGMDDCLHLDKCIEKYGFGEKGFEEYFKLQKPKADALARITLDNFQVLTMKFNEPEYLQIKKLEKKMEAITPQKFWSKYRMVYFGDRPYSQIQTLIPKYHKILLQAKQKRLDAQKLSVFSVQKLMNELSLSS